VVECLPRPQAIPADHHRLWVRKTIRDTLPTIVPHPKDGVRKIRAVAKEKVSVQHVEDAGVPGAPEPPYAVGDERLEHQLEPRQKVPPAKALCDPPRTRALLYKRFGLRLLITFTPTWLLVQMSLLMLGISFFILNPDRPPLPTIRATHIAFHLAVLGHTHPCGLVYRAPAG
jgi:hypothetical protein